MFADIILFAGACLSGWLFAELTIWLLNKRLDR